MPNLNEHCAQSLQRYRVDGKSLHTWIDEPVKVAGPNHRKFRHSNNQEVPSFAIEEYGEELARNIIIDHISLDRNTGDLVLTEEEETQILKENIKSLREEKRKLEYQNNRDIELIRRSEILHILEFISADILYFGIDNSYKSTVSRTGSPYEDQKTEFNINLKDLLHIVYILLDEPTRGSAAENLKILNASLHTLIRNFIRDNEMTTTFWNSTKNTNINLQRDFINLEINSQNPQKAY